jgi:hypothetical protein
MENQIFQQDKKLISDDFNRSSYYFNDPRRRSPKLSRKLNKSTSIRMKGISEVSEKAESEFFSHETTTNARMATSPDEVK